MLSKLINKKRAQSYIKIAFVFIAISLILVSAGLFIKADFPDTIPDMPEGEKSGEIVNIDGTILNVSWKRIDNGKFDEERFILDVSQLPNSSTAGTTYTIQPQLFLLDTNFNLSEFSKENLEITAYQYQESLDYYYNYTKIDTCEETETNSTNETNSSWNYPECNETGEEIVVEEGRIPFSEGSYCNTEGVTCSASYSISSYNPAMIGSGSLPIADSMFQRPVIIQHEDGSVTEVSNTSLNELQVPAYDGTKNSHKYFDIKISNIPIDKSKKYMQTTGTFAVEVGGKLFWDKTHSSWWNSSFLYKRNITNASTNLLLPLNCSGGTSCTSDIDGDGNNEVLYGVPSGSSASVYYNNDTDSVVANDTTETCIIDTENNRSSCPNPPEGLVAHYSLNKDDAKDYIGNNDGTNEGAT
ncbi:MAG: hypothetical protein ACOC3Z_03440, partial [Nanoarchaeota archaeon]